MDMQHSLSYDIDLSGEPSGISAYMVLPADTTQESQNLGLMVERLCSECAIAARVRQYYGGNREDFYDLLDWTSLNVSVDNELTISVDKAAVQAGGKTILELKMTSSNSLPFVSGAKVVLTNPWTIQTLLVPQNHVATICDGGDDYRFGFNGQEKVNEIAGTGNHNTALFWEYGTREGRRWNRDPKPIPDESEYAVNRNNPIQFNDPNGDFPFFLPILAGLIFTSEVLDAPTRDRKGDANRLNKARERRDAQLGQVLNPFSELNLFSAATRTLKSPVDNTRFQRPTQPKVQVQQAKEVQPQTTAKPYTNSRPPYSKGQVEKVWENNKQSDGKVYDPNTGQELTWDKNKSRNGQWDMGHKPGKEYRKLQKDYMDGKISKDKFLEEYQNHDNYQPELPSNNRSRQFEQKTPGEAKPQPQQQ